MRLKFHAFLGWFLSEQFPDVPSVAVSDTFLDAMLMSIGKEAIQHEQLADLHALRIQAIADSLDAKGRGMGFDPILCKNKKTYNPDKIAHLANLNGRFDFTVTTDMVREAQCLK